MFSRYVRTRTDKSCDIWGNFRNVKTSFRDFNKLLTYNLLFGGQLSRARIILC